MKDRHFSVDELLADESFQRWAQGIATDEEDRYWVEWAAEQSSHELNAIEARNVLMYVQPTTRNGDLRPEAIDAEWNRLIERIEDDRQNHLSIPRFRLSRPVLLRAAAIVTLLMTFTVLIGRYFDAKWPFANSALLVTGTEEQAKVTLPDGSSVILNANSSLIYAGSDRGPDVRRVALQGEAFFDIRASQESAGSSFIVQTELGVVRVLGTRFNVIGLEDRLQVSVSEGRVVVEKTAPNGQLLVSSDLVSGQLGEIFLTDDTIEVRDVNPEVYSSWTGSLLIFDNTPFGEIASRLERTYGYQVVVRDSSTFDVVIHGSIENDHRVLLEGLPRLLYRTVTVQDKLILIE